MAVPKLRLQFNLSALIAAVAVVAIWLNWINRQIETVHERDELFKAGIGWSKSLVRPARLPFWWKLLGAQPVNKIRLSPDRFSVDDLRKYRAAFPEAHVFRAYLSNDPGLRQWSRHRKPPLEWDGGWGTLRPPTFATAAVIAVAIAVERFRRSVHGHRRPKIAPSTHVTCHE